MDQRHAELGRVSVQLPNNGLAADLYQWGRGEMSAVGTCRVATMLHHSAERPHEYSALCFKKCPLCNGVCSVRWRSRCAGVWSRHERQIAGLLCSCNLR
jgi:hypothetical protein